MKVQVHKCKVTGKIFEEKDRTKYILHLKKIRAQQKEKRLHAIIVDGFGEWLANERANIFDVQDIIPWFLKNQRYIMDATNAISFRNSRDYEKFQPVDKFIDIAFKYIRYSPFTSNSHSCPDNGVQNWCARNPGPTGYPGWDAHISGKLIRPPKYNSSYPYSEALNLVGIKTESGGGGNESWGYDVKIFAADWPGLEQGLVVNKLKGIS